MEDKTLRDIKNLAQRLDIGTLLKATRIFEEKLSEDIDLARMITQGVPIPVDFESGRTTVIERDNIHKGEGHVVRRRVPLKFGSVKPANPKKWSRVIAMPDVFYASYKRCAPNKRCSACANSGFRGHGPYYTAIAEMKIPGGRGETQRKLLYWGRQAPRDAIVKPGRPAKMRDGQEE